MLLLHSKILLHHISRVALHVRTSISQQNQVDGHESLHTGGWKERDHSAGNTHLYRLSEKDIGDLRKAQAPIHTGPNLRPCMQWYELNSISSDEIDLFLRSADIENIAEDLEMLGVLKIKLMPGINRGVKIPDYIPACSMITLRFTVNEVSLVCY